MEHPFFTVISKTDENHVSPYFPRIYKLLKALNSK